MSESFSFSNYEIFNDAIKDVNTLNTEIKTAENLIKECQTQLGNESIFMGPIADLCKNEFNKLLTQISSMEENFNNTTSVLSNTNNQYKNGEVQAKNMFQSATSSTVPASDSAIEPHSRVAEIEGRWEERVNALGGSDAENIVDIQVPYWDGNEEKTMTLTVNKHLEDNYQNVFRELTDMKFPIKPENTDAYEYRTKATGSGSLSDHAYGGTVDINYDDNPMVGAGEANPCDDGNNPYVVNDAVVQAFAKQGFYWGGDWNSPKDYMHFSWTGR